MPGPATSTMYDLARTALDAVVAHWPDDAEPLPETQFVSNGLIAADGCELLAVRVDRAFNAEADPAVEQIISQGPGFTNRCIVLAFTLLRCVPVVLDENNIPLPSEIEASASIVLRDGQAMFNALVNAKRVGELGGCSSMAFSGYQPEGPQGGAGGGTLLVRFMVM